METLSSRVAPDMRAALTLAGQFVEKQASVPVSPAETDEQGNVSLCAAACLAKAGLQLSFSEAVAESFARKLASTLSPSLLEDSFETLGWARALCHHVRAENNNAPAAVRKREVLQMFEELKGQLPTCCHWPSAISLG